MKIQILFLCMCALLLQGCIENTHVSINEGGNTLDKDSGTPVDPAPAPDGAVLKLRTDS